MPVASLELERMVQRRMCLVTAMTLKAGVICRAVDIAQDLFVEAVERTSINGGGCGVGRVGRKRVERANRAGQRSVISGEIVEADLAAEGETRTGGCKVCRRRSQRKCLASSDRGADLAKVKTRERS